MDLAYKIPFQIGLNVPVATTVGPLPPLQQPVEPQEVLSDRLLPLGQAALYPPEFFPPLFQEKKQLLCLWRALSQQQWSTGLCQMLSPFYRHTVDPVCQWQCVFGSHNY